MITGLLHASLLVGDVGKARAFYEDVLGLVQSPLRPPMSFEGVWYDIGKCQIHLLCLPNPKMGLSRPQHGGRDRHIALAVESMDSLIQKLDKAGIAFTRSQSGRAALFCRDPDDNALEFIETSG